jgi:hypothetical protein
MEVQEVLEKVNKILEIVGYKMEEKENSNGGGFRTIIEISSGKNIGQQPIWEDWSEERILESTVRWIANYSYSKGYIHGRKG